MTPRDLIAAFEAVADAPDGIKRLRELVLQLAVRGKLVPQDPKDEPATRLLAKISAKRDPRTTDGMKRRSSFSADDAPFAAPRGWALVAFGEVFVDIFTGPFGTSLKAAEYVDEGTPIVNPQNIRDGVVVPTKGTFVGPSTVARLSSFILRERDIVVARRGEMGRCAVVHPDNDGWLCGTGSLVLRPPSCVSPDFVALYLRSPWTVARLAGDSVGSTMNNLNQRIMVSLPFGLPPLAEQHRIVARVEELMGLLDRLEAAHEAREKTRASARDAALVALREAADAEEVEASWSRVAERLGDLCARPEDVKPLREAVLELAVRGRLVPQDPTEGAARELLSTISDERSRRVRAGLMGEEKRPAPIRDDERPYRLPPLWQWCRIADAFHVVGGLQKSGKRRPATNAHPYLRVANVQRGWLDLRELAQFELFEGELDRCRLVPGDLLVVEGNGSEHEIGRCARWAGEVDGCVHQNHLIRCRPLAPGMEWFVLRYLNSPTGMGIMKALAVTTSGLFNLSVGKIKQIAIPVPPLAEQRRIVAKVEEVMAHLDRIEGKLREAQETQAAFAAAAVHHLDADEGEGTNGMAPAA